VFLPTFAASGPIDVATVRAMAVAAERYGLTYAFLGDHLVWNVGMLAPMPTIGYLAAATERILLGTGVYLLPLRPPVLAAKDVATVDALTGGRLVLGVGAGGENPLEYRAAGVEPGHRGLRMTEGLAALRSLLRGEGTAIEGRFTNVPAVRLAPNPPREIPVWLGGRADAVVERAARSADGWFPVWISARRYADARQRVLAAGRTEDDFVFALNLFVALDDSREAAREVVARHMETAYNLNFDSFARYAAYGTADDIKEIVEPYRTAGVTDVVFNLTGPDQPAMLDRLATEVLPWLDQGAPRRP
jgi:alkanesulfonate monooxygenase SsuD/methylene tetrahydromethanopterin reductase-like flavin-dependent oxidoreductase (luciferase family)